MSKTLSVAFRDADGAERAVRVAPGATFLDAAREASIDVDATCGGRGRCRSCRVKVLKGAMAPATIMDTVQLGHDEVHEGFRLSCQNKVIEDCTVLVAPPRAEGGHQLLSAGDATPAGLDLDSGVVKRLVTAELPMDEDDQISDAESVLAAAGIETPLSLEVARDLPQVLRAKKGTVTVTTFLGEVIDVEAGDTTAEAYGFAFDIGTTSVVGSLIDLSSGEQLAGIGSVNPQAVFGGDLMSRIAYAQFNPQALKKLRARIVSALDRHMREACAEAGVEPSHVYKVVVVGNTCMHHIFLGIDPSHVGLAPYAPVVREPIIITAREALLKSVPKARVCLLPIVAGFVGADTAAAVLATRLDEENGIRILVDIGTNGEMVMSAGGRLVACSAPAGPALEGAQIRDGMRGAVGAIERVRIDADVDCDIIGDAPAIGICGSGLVDAVAAMLDAGVLKSSGLIDVEGRDGLAPALAARLTENDSSRQFILVPAAEAGGGADVGLTQTDIRQLQLAKGAIFAGIRMLRHVMDIDLDTIDELLLSGAFGNYINKESAVRIRLLPGLATERITYVGNAAGMGAQMALISETERRRAETIARRIEHVSLAMRPEFQDIFVDALLFTEDEGDAAAGGGGRRRAADRG